MSIRRRTLLAAGLGTLLPAPVLAAVPASGRLAFAVFRNGTKVGEHRMSFDGAAGDVAVTTEVEIVVRLGPVPVYRYRHQASERWAGGRFERLSTTTVANGSRKQVTATRGGSGVTIQGPAGRVQAPPAAAPLTHWNPQALDQPLFNPQEGKLLKVTVRRTGPGRYAIRGDAEIDNTYDEAGVWRALRGKLEDGSTMEYRRL